MSDIKNAGENELLTPRQAAKLLKIGYITILTYIRQGLIPAMAINPTSKQPHYRIRANDLNKLLVRVKTDEEKQLENTPPGEDLPQDKKPADPLGNVKIVG